MKRRAHQWAGGFSERVKANPDLARFLSQVSHRLAVEILIGQLVHMGLNSAGSTM
jgi:hypothetical protein